VSSAWAQATHISFSEIDEFIGPDVERWERSLKHWLAKYDGCSHLRRLGLTFLSSTDNDNQPDVADGAQQGDQDDDAGDGSQEGDAAAAGDDDDAAGDDDTADDSSEWQEVYAAEEPDDGFPDNASDWTGVQLFLASPASGTSQQPPADKEASQYTGFLDSDAMSADGDTPDGPAVSIDKLPRLLEHLELCGCGLATDTYSCGAGGAFNDLNKLTHLELVECHVSAESLDGLATFTSLKHLALSHVLPTDFAALVRLPALLPQLQHLTHLTIDRQDLSCLHEPFNGGPVDVLVGLTMTALQHLCLWGAGGLDPTGLESLQWLRHRDIDQTPMYVWRLTGHSRLPCCPAAAAAAQPPALDAGGRSRVGTVAPSLL
jgi:hypothetical protein